KGADVDAEDAPTMRRRGMYRKRSGMLRFWPAILWLLMLASADSLIYGRTVDTLKEGAIESVESAMDHGPEGVVSAISPRSTRQTVGGTAAIFQFIECCFSAADGQSVEFSTCPPEGMSTRQTSIEVRSADGTLYLPPEWGPFGCLN